MLKTAAILLLSILLAQNICAQNPEQKNRRRMPIINGAALYLPPPEYPNEAREKCAGGQVAVDVLLDEKGEVIAAEVVSGDKTLREAAIEAVKKAKFRMFGYARLKGSVLYDFDPLKICDARVNIVELPLGRVNKKARILPMPHIPPEISLPTGNIIVKVKIDLQKGAVVSAEANTGDVLLRESAEAAARHAVFKPVLNEFRTIYATGTIIYGPEDFNGAARVNNRPEGFLILTRRALNDRAISVPKPKGVRVGEKFIAGRVEVAVLLPMTGGGIIIANAFSGPEELRGPSEQAAMEVKFAAAFIDGAFAYVIGMIVYTFRENGKVE
jgi:TonB family protein